MIEERLEYLLTFRHPLPRRAIVRYRTQGLARELAPTESRRFPGEGSPKGRWSSFIKRVVSTLGLRIGRAYV